MFSNLAKTPIPIIAALWIGAVAGGASAAHWPFETQRLGTKVSETVLYAFHGGTDGADPVAPLVAEKRGALYGTTLFGGGSAFCSGSGPFGQGCGIVFKLTPKAAGYAETVLHRFAGGTGDGAFPEAGLIVDHKGALYGTTAAGGTAPCPGGSDSISAYGCGTVFKLTPGPSGYRESVIYRFAGATARDGSQPSASLLLGAKGILYGTTSSGGKGSQTDRFCGTQGCGTVFMLAPSGSGYAESVLYRFQGNPDVAVPTAALLADGSGAFYGTAQAQGPKGTRSQNGCGGVFKLSPQGTQFSESILFGFDCLRRGGLPASSLIVDKKGALYGTAEIGGNAGAGNVFVLTPAGSRYGESVLASLGVAKGAQPVAGLTAAADGTLYGTAALAGNSASACSIGGCGTVFGLVPSGGQYRLHVIYRFSDTDGARPVAGLIADPQGALYGTTGAGGDVTCTDGDGPAGCGTVFEIAPRKEL